jgi:hypothetical protein
MAVLLLVFFQDLKSRTIHLALPIAIFLLSLFINYLSLDMSFDVISYNVVFILINVIGLSIYFSFKNKVLVNPIDTYIGLGDIIFFLALTPLLHFKPFILFFVIGLFFSLLIHFVFLLFKPVQTIPLAGYLSLFLIINIAAKSFFKINMLF